MQLSGLKKCFQCVKSVIKAEGILALYRSLPITMIMNAPYAITTVTVNENMKKLVEPKKKNYKFLAYFYCAAFAGMIASFITCPLDNIKTKLQTQSTLASCEKIESMVNKLENEMLKGKSKPCDSSDIKILIEQEEKHLIKYKNIRETAKLIYREDGLKRGFFRGLVPRIMCNSPSCAISWASYEFMKHIFS